MPWAAPRYCYTPGHVAFTGRRCPSCERDAPSASARGYDRQWRKLRERVLYEEPLCRLCQAAGRVEAATEVDHIIPLRVRPELRLERSNARPLCGPCHRQVTGAFNRSRGIGGSKSGSRAPETAPPQHAQSSRKWGFPGNEV
jgi:hypothetical protein